jgi:hypothetical protein
VKSHEIDRAVDIRDALPVVCHASRVLQQFADNKLTFEQAHERALAAGVDNHEYGVLERFRKAIIEPSFEEGLAATSGQPRNKVVYELGKILTRTKSLLSKLR